MSEALKLGAVAVVALVGGFVGGRMWPDQGGEVDTAAQPEPSVAAPVAPAEPTVSERPADPANAQRCQDAEVELRFSRARRAVDQTRDTTIRRAFTDGTKLEDSLPWTELAESVVEACLPDALTLRFIECSEYPCVAVLEGPEDAAARDEIEYVASEQLEHCAPLGATFGEDYPVESAVFLPFPVTCPDAEDEQAWAMLLLDPEGAALDDFMSDPVDRAQAARINRWIYRRANDVDRKWICEGEEPTDASG